MARGILINEVTEMMDVPGIFLLHLTRNLNFADKLNLNPNPNPNHFHSLDYLFKFSILCIIFHPIWSYSNTPILKLKSRPYLFGVTLEGFQHFDSAQPIFLLPVVVHPELPGLQLMTHAFYLRKQNKTNPCSRRHWYFLSIQHLFLF